jgi:phage terminase large subunit-like protein
MRQALDYQLAEAERLLPHRIPPTGDWWLWLLLGDRGDR